MDYKVTEKKLEEIFKIAGKLVKVELNVDNEGKSKGHGTAEYEHPLEAVQAICILFFHCFSVCVFFLISYVLEFKKWNLSQNLLQPIIAYFYCK